MRAASRANSFVLETQPARRQHQRPLGKYQVKLEDRFQLVRDVFRLPVIQLLTCWKHQMTDGAVALQDEAADRHQVTVRTQVVPVL